MSDASENTPPGLPQSLGEHVVPDDRAQLIRQHVRMLGETALQVSDQLPFSADTSDFIRVLNDEAEDK